MSTLALNQPLPPANATLHDGSTQSLHQLIGEGGLVVFFYPKNNTPACTQEAQDFRDHYPAFEQFGIRLLGVSKDGVRSHANVINKHQLPFALASDPDQTLSKAFDVIKLKKLYGKEYLGIERSSFLIDAQGVLRYEWRGLRVPGHVEAVLAQAQALFVS